MPVTKVQKSREDITLQREQDLLSHKRDFQRVFNTESGKRVIQFMEATVPRPLVGKTKSETIRNSAMRDFMDFIQAMIKDPEQQQPHPDDAPSDRARKVTHGE